MIVFYTKDKHEVMGWCNGTPSDIIDGNIVRSSELTMHGVNWEKVEYKEYKFKDIPSPVQDEDGIGIPQILEDLGLELMTEADRPRDLAAEIDELKTKVNVLERAGVVPSVG